MIADSMSRSMSARMACSVNTAGTPKVRAPAVVRSMAPNHRPCEHLFARGSVHQMPIRDSDLSPTDCHLGCHGLWIKPLMAAPIRDTSTRIGAAVTRVGQESGHTVPLESGGPIPDQMKADSRQGTTGMIDGVWTSPSVREPQESGFESVGAIIERLRG